MEAGIEGRPAHIGEGDKAPMDQQLAAEAEHRLTEATKGVEFHTVELERAQRTAEAARACLDRLQRAEQPHPATRMA